MKLLLDTHAFLWWDGDHTRLSQGALTACVNPANSLFLSVVSVWELQIKTQLGKLTLRLPLRDILEEQQRNHLRITPVGLEDIYELSVLPMIHRDPFDRLIVAQAKRGDFHLISHDPQVGRYDVAVLW